ncbi:hypothetical protein SPHINGOR109_20129 [Sphingorhabdus sp. 109]|nr:hypothetical protein SPHINGOR109_20129 [Sphingorhabdus sp. 109]
MPQLRKKVGFYIPVGQDEKPAIAGEML